MTASTRDARAVELNRTAKRELIRMCQTGIRRPDGGRTTLEGAYPLAEWSKDDLITSILSIEFPRGET